MKMLILGIPNTLNYGSMMMAENFIGRYAETVKSLDAIIVTPNRKETVSRLQRALGTAGSNVTFHTVHPSEVFRGSGKRLLLCVTTGLGFSERLAAEIADADVVVVLGGDDYTEDYGYRGPLWNLLLLKGLLGLGKRVYMCSQTVGPFHPWRRALFARLLRGVDAIVAREPITFEYLTTKLGLKNIHLGADLAFLPLMMEGQEEYTCPFKDFVTLVPSELIWRYTADQHRMSYMRFLTRISQRIMSEYPQLGMVILPHVLAPAEADDRIAAREIYATLEAAGIGPTRVLLVDEPLLPYQARSILGQSALAITGRMHGAVSTFEQGVPAVSLSYSRKYHGVIGQYLGFPHLVVDVRNKSWHDIEIEVWTAVQHIMKHRQVIAQEITRKVQAMQDAAKVNIEILRSR